MLALSAISTRKFVAPLVGAGSCFAKTKAMATTTVRVGVDLTSIEEIRGSIVRFGDRYLRRCFTEHELVTSSGCSESRAASLAARFAAKEATVKALAAGNEAVDWRAIEIRRRSDGGCGVLLHGALAQLAERQGITEFAVSLTHEGQMAAAVVIALCCTSPEGAARRSGTTAETSGFEGERQ